MTEFSPDQDELASAYLDGEATDAERALVERDPDLLARVDALRAVRDTLAAPTSPLTADQRDTAITNALRASPIVDLHAERARRRLRIASIAAAIVVAVGAAALLVRLAPSSSSNKSTATAAGAAASSSSAERAPQQAGGGATAGAVASVPGTFSFETRDALGAFNDQAALTDAARTRLHERLSVDHTKEVAPSASATGAANADDSAAVAAPCAVSGPPNAVSELYAASATLQGRAVQIDVFSLTDDTLMLVATDAATCTQVFSQSV